MTQPLSPSLPSSAAPAEPESLAELRGDCARMAHRWPRVAPAPEPAGPLADSGGVAVSADSARLVAGLSEYGG